MPTLTKIQIIDETVEYYSKNPRSITKTGCKYRGDNGAKCAFARCCTDDSDFSEDLKSNVQENVVLLPNYAHIPYNDQFWKELQLLHDTTQYWNDQQLTEKGKEYLHHLKAIY